MMVSSRVISSTLDNTDCWVSPSCSPLIKVISTHLSTMDTVLPQVQRAARSHTAAKPRRRAANCRTGSSRSCFDFISPRILTWLLCLITARVSISLRRSATLMVSTLTPNALCTAFSKAASGQCMRSSLSLSVSVTLEALTYWFHLTLNCLKSSWLLPPLISGLGILDRWVLAPPAAPPSLGACRP